MIKYVHSWNITKTYFCLMMRLYFNLILIPIKCLCKKKNITIILKNLKYMF